MKAHDDIDWLLQEVDVYFNSDQARLVPLLSDGRVVKVAAFELDCPDDVIFLGEKSEMAVPMAGTVLGLAMTKEGRGHWAQRFAQVDGVRAAPIRSDNTRSYDVMANAPAGPWNHSHNNLALRPGPHLCLPPENRANL